MNDFERLLKMISEQPACGLGCIILPPDVDKQTFIDRCFSTETVSIMSQAGGLSYNNVPISIDALQQIEFPEDSTKFGSVVVFLFHPKTKKPIIVAVLTRTSELYGVEWKQFKRFKNYKDNYVSVVGDGKKGTLIVNVQGTANNGGGQIFINVGEPSNKGNLKISVQGDISFINQNFSINCVATKITNKEAFELTTKSLTMNVKEDWNVETEKNTKINSGEKISLGGDNYEPLVLGQKLVDDIFKPLFSALKTDLQVSTAMGPSGPPLPTFTAKIVQLEQKLNTILSQKTETE